MSHWTIGQRTAGWLAGALLLGFGAVAIAIGAYAAGGGTPYNDFFANWSAAQLFRTGETGRVYDLAFLNEFRRALDPGFDPTQPFLILPFTYPPVYLLILWPLSRLSFGAGYAVWVLFTFALYAAALLPWVERRARPAVGLLLLVAPSTVYCISFGQNGFLTAALITLGLRLARPRPLLAGVLLGLMVFKPQLGLLVPVALAAAGLWRTFAAAAATALLMVALSVGVLGGAMWHGWFATAAGFSQDVQLHGQALWHLMPTVMANLLLAGVASPVAEGAQLATAVVAGAAVWFAFRRGASGGAIGVLQAATLLATPFGFVYDLPIVTLAIAGLAPEWFRPGVRIALPEAALLAATLLLPYLMAAEVTPLPLSAAGLCLLLGVLVRRRGKEAGGLCPGRWPLEPRQRESGVLGWRPWPFLALLLVALPHGALADELGCEAAGAEAERAWQLPSGLLAAIGRIESGRYDPATGRVASWPWTINAAGQGHYFDSGTAAIAAVRDLQMQGVRLIDVGCFQIDLFYHPQAFATLEEAFDARANANYAARFLTDLYGRTGSWEGAIAAYHSAVPEEGGPYRSRVMADWQGGGLRIATAPPSIRAARAAAVADPVAVLLSAAALRVRVWSPGAFAVRAPVALAVAVAADPFVPVRRGALSARLPRVITPHG